MKQSTSAMTSILEGSGNPTQESGSATAGSGTKKKSRSSRDAAAIKRRCVSTACIACRRRKSKCDGNTPSCAACASVYGTECIYDPNSDHRRKGVYKEKIDSLKTRNSTLQTLIQAILNATEDDVPTLVRRIRTCESLDDVADEILRQEQGAEEEENDDDDLMIGAYGITEYPTFESEISSKMGELRLEHGSVRFIGGTSNMIYLTPDEIEGEDFSGPDTLQQQDDPLLSWTTVTQDAEVIVHLMNMYFTWHYPYFTTLSKKLFYRDFLLGKPPGNPKRPIYCSSLLVNAMLALGCHFTSSPAGMTDPNDTATKGDAFFAEAKRLIYENDEYERPRLTTIQALALMSVREAGCGREAKGWVYSGMSFRMALDMGLNLESGAMAASKETMDEKDIDARRITFWGCFLFDKCWSNYLGRLPQLPVANVTVSKYDVFPDEDSDVWSPYTDNGVVQMNSQPSRTRAIALQISKLCEISNDVLIFFYHPQALEKSMGKSAELKKLSELHTRLEAWRRDLPKEFEAKEGQLPPVILMHMFFHLLYIHLFRPFLKYSPSTSPLPSHVSPRKICTQAAGQISKLMRLYKRTYGLRQICNIAVYMVHSASTVHLLNLPEKTSKRDIIHGLKQLEEIAEDWLCARRTLSILSVLARKWKIELPEEASAVLARTDAKFGFFSTADVPSPSRNDAASVVSTSSPRNPIQQQPQQAQTRYYNPQQDSPVGSNGTGLGNVNLVSNSPANSLPPNTTAAIMQNIPAPTLSPSRSNFPMTVPPESPSYIATTTYAQHHPVPATSMPTQQPNTVGQTGGSDTGGSPAAVSTNASMVRQVSPGTMFGGVDALLESQDWWLKDQASLAVGFDNWVGLEGDGGYGGIVGGLDGFGMNGGNVNTGSFNMNMMGSAGGSNSNGGASSGGSGFDMNGQDWYGET